MMLLIYPVIGLITLLIFHKFFKQQSPEPRPAPAQEWFELDTQEERDTYFYLFLAENDALEAYERNVIDFVERTGSQIQPFTIEYSFDWGNTPEGYLYWDNLNDKFYGDLHE